MDKMIFNGTMKRRKLWYLSSMLWWDQNSYMSTMFTYSFHEQSQSAARCWRSRISLFLSNILSRLAVMWSYSCSSSDIGAAGGRKAEHQRLSTIVIARPLLVGYARKIQMIGAIFSRQLFSKEQLSLSEDLDRPRLWCWAPYLYLKRLGIREWRCKFLHLKAACDIITLPKTKRSQTYSWSHRWLSFPVLNGIYSYD